MTLLAEFFQLPPAGDSAPFRHNLPFATLGPLFHGRAEILARLCETLLRTPAGRATAIAGKAIHGLGGVGKTRLAVEYAWQHAKDYTAVLFVGADSPADLRRNLAVLCAPDVLDLPEHATREEDAQVIAVLRRLAEQPGWLLILDNVDSPEAAEAVDSLVAHLHGGHVLLTGRLARWGAEVEAIELDLLTEEAATAFLLARTENGRRATPEDAAHATTLARELGCLPLALEQAGAAIALRKLTFAGYLADWKTRHDQVLTWFDPRVSHYPVSFAVTWQTSVDRLTAPARRLLERLAWLGPEPIPESLLETPVPGLAEAEESLDPRDALVELATYSLVTRASEAPTFTVHRLVQDVTRRSLRHAPGHRPLTEALNWVDAAFQGDARDVRTWPILDPLAPHTRALVGFADAAKIAEPTARLMNDLALLLDAKALHSEAEPLMRRMVTIFENSPGEGNPNVAAALNNLAHLLQATNRLDEAEPLMRRALAIDEHYFGMNHPRVATALNNLAHLLQATNRLAEAEPMMRQALVISEKRFGTDHPKVATALNNLALLLHATNRLAEAEPLMRRGLSILESNRGEDHPSIATVLNSLALLLQYTNRLGEAEPMMRRVVKIFERSLGEDHPNVASALSNLAWLLKTTNRPEEAEPLMRRALTISEKRFGPEHTDVAIGLHNLALLLRDTQRFFEAEPLLRRAITIFESSLGEDHPDAATAVNSLAQLLHATQRFVESEPLMRRVVTIFERSFGEDHPNVAAALNNLAALLLSTNRFSEAEPLMHRALAINEKSFGPDHPEVAIQLHNLAGLFQATNRLGEAEPLMRRALAIFLEFESRTGHEHPHYQVSSLNHRSLLKTMGKSQRRDRGGAGGIWALIRTWLKR